MEDELTGNIKVDSSDTAGPGIMSFHLKSFQYNVDEML